MSIVISETYKHRIKVLLWCERLYSRYLVHSSLGKDMVSGASWSIAGAIGLRGLSLLGGIIVANLLGRSVYGQWGVIEGIAALFGCVGSLGMSTAAAKYVAELKKTDPCRCGRALSLILVVALVGISITSLACLGLAKLMAYRLYNAPELFVPLMVTSLMLFCLMGTITLEGVMAGFEDFRGIARISAIQGMALFIAIVLLTYRLGLVGAVLAMAVSQGIGLCLYLVAMFKQCREHGIRLGKTGMWQELRIVWHYAVPGFLISSIVHPTNLLSYAMVANTPGGFGGLGGYNAAARWREMVLFIPRATKRITLPILSKLQAANDSKRFRKALWANVAINGGISLAVALPLMALSPWILRLYGPEFSQDWDILVVLLGVGVSRAVIEVLVEVLASREKMWCQSALHVVWAAIILGGSYLLVPQYGVRGFLWAYALATIILMLSFAGATVILMKRYYESMVPK